MGFLMIIVALMAVPGFLIAYGEILDRIAEIAPNIFIDVLPLIIFEVLLICCLALIAYGLHSAKKWAFENRWGGVFSLVIVGGITLIFVLVLNYLAQGQLHLIYVKAAPFFSRFVGLRPMLEISGMILFLASIGAGLAQLGFALWGSFRIINGISARASNSSLTNTKKEVMPTR